MSAEVTRADRATAIRPVRHSEMLHAALWRSVAAEVLGGAGGRSGLFRPSGPRRRRTASARAGIRLPGPAAQRAALAVLHRHHPDTPLDPSSPAVLAPAPGAKLVRLRDDEVAWHIGHAIRFPGRSVLLSHHQLYSARWKIGRRPATINRFRGRHPCRPRAVRGWISKSPNYGF